MIRATCVLLALLLFQASFAGEWEQEKDELGIKIYQKEDAYYDVDQVKGVLFVEGTVEAAEALFRDIEGYPMWLDNCTNAKLLKKISDNEFIVYIAGESPWPFQKRDVVFKARFEKGFGELRLTLKNFEESDYFVKDYHRIPYFAGSYEVFQHSKNVIKIISKLRSDPGGYVPSFAVNLALPELVWWAMKNLKLSIPYFNHLYGPDADGTKPLKPRFDQRKTEEYLK